MFAKSFFSVLLIANALGTLGAAHAVINYPKGCYTVSPATSGPINADILNNPGIVGVGISEEWRELEAAGDNKFDWADLDARISEATAKNKKVVLAIVASAAKAPAWLMDNPKVEKVIINDPNKNHKRSSGPLTVALPWGSLFHAQKLELLRKAGEHFSKNPSVVAVMVGFANYFTNDWALPAEMKTPDYTYEKLLAVGKEILTTASSAFPNQAIKLPLGKIRRNFDPGKNPTQMAEDILAFVKKSDFESRFFAQKNLINTKSPVASDAALATATPNENNYLLKLLRDRTPLMGLQMVAGAINGPKDGCRQNGHVSPCPPRPVMEKSISIALSYRPSFLEFWKGDASEKSFYPLFVNATRDLQK